jgi:hypothetical protein
MNVLRGSSRRRNDAPGAAADLADAWEAFADQAGTPGGPGEVWVTVGTLHTLEQRTVQLPANLADWITELLREDIEALEAGTAGRDAAGGLGGEW